MEKVDLSVNVYPIEEPKNNTMAFASVGIKVDGEDLVAIRGIRVYEGERGLNVSMPQSKDKEDNYHDIAFPLSKQLRKDLHRAVLDEYPIALEAMKRSIENRLRDNAEKAAQQKPPAERSAAAKSYRAGSLE